MEWLPGLSRGGGVGVPPGRRHRRDLPPSHPARGRALLHRPGGGVLGGNAGLALGRGGAGVPPRRLGNARAGGVRLAHRLVPLVAEDEGSTALSLLTGKEIVKDIRVKVRIVQGGIPLIVKIE